MNIVATQFNLENKALEIYVSGCTLKCKGCHNLELQDFNIGENYEDKLASIELKINEFSNIIDNIWILGGEPLDQNYDDLLNMIYYLSFLNKKIWIFTGYTFNIAYDKMIKTKDRDAVFDYIDYFKYGKYDETKLIDDKYQYGIKLASSNQGVFKL